MSVNEPAIPHDRLAAVVRHHLKPLSDFVRREIAYREAIGDLLDGEVHVEDVVDEVLARAAEQTRRGGERVRRVPCTCCYSSRRRSPRCTRALGSAE